MAAMLLAIVLQLFSSSQARLQALEVAHSEGTFFQRHYRKNHQAEAEFEAEMAKEQQRDVVVCRGIGDMNESQFKELGQVWDRYAGDGVITGTSALLYKITPEGKFEAFATEDNNKFEDWTKTYLTPSGVKALPHVFCDSTCCKTCDLPAALLAAMKQKDEFFGSTVSAAKKFGWHGYALDFEGSEPDRDQMTKFFKEWQEELAQHTGPDGTPLELHLWSRSGADEEALASSMSSVIDMSAYYQGSYSSLMQGGDNQDSDAALVSWQKYRAEQLRQVDGTSSVCPAGNVLNSSMMESVAIISDSSNANNSAHLNRTQRVNGLKDEMEGWCSRMGKNKCALGLITYDLPNQNLPCEDMVHVGTKAISEQLNSIWIWSGGVVATEWEVGLKHFIDGGDASTAMAGCSAKASLIAESQASASGTGCSFDGNYFCNGQRRSK